MKNLANYLTLLRVLLCIFLFFTYPFSFIFYLVYILCGLTDILDGFVARSFKLQTEFGARFDSFADIIFCIVSFIKIVPSIFDQINIKLWFWAIIILIIKCLTQGLNSLKNETVGMIHSFLNKAAGLCLFLAPLFFDVMDMNAICAICCVVASFAAIEELLMILLYNDLDLDRRTLYRARFNTLKRKPKTCELEEDYKKYKKKSAKLLKKKKVQDNEYVIRNYINKSRLK